MNVTDLVLHVGFPKTATTALQRRIFPQIPGYIGKHGSEDDRLWLRVLRDWRVGSASINEHLRQWVQSRSALGQPRHFLSYEELSGWPSQKDSAIWPMNDTYRTAHRSGEHPITQFLSHLHRHLPPGWRLRIIMTVRAQGPLLASLYSQLEGDMQAPGQIDFERKVRRFLDEGDSFLDYASLLLALQSIVTPSDILVLVHEDGLPENIRRIGRFLTTEVDDSALPSAPKNAKSVGVQEWQAVRRAPLVYAGRFGTARRALRARVPRPRRQIALAVWEHLRRLERLVIARLPSKPASGEKISLHPLLLAEIQNHHALSNNRLSKILGREHMGAEWESTP